MRLFNLSFAQFFCCCRTDYVEQNEKLKEFIGKLKNGLISLLKHDFIASKQSSYFSRLKETLKKGEMLVTLDFSQNYAFKIQDSIQSQYWVNSQATLHPYVVYYKKGKAILHDCFVVIGENDKHDSVAVSLYNKALIKFLKTKHGVRAITKIYYFFDGAASQYKNRKNFVNWLNHQRF